MTDDEALTYQVWRGETLLLTRRGSPEVIAAVRAAFEPLSDGFHATLGTGTPQDPTVATGTVNNDDPVQIQLRNARAMSDLVTKMAKDNLQVLEFSKTMVAETMASVFRAREEARTEEEKRWTAHLASVQAAHQEALRQLAAQQSRPIINGEAVGQLGTLVGTLTTLIQQRGVDPKNNGGTNG